MCRTCEKLFVKIGEARLAESCCEYKLRGIPRHYPKPWYSRVITAEVGIDTYWTFKKMVEFEEWLKSNGFKINHRRTRWIDFTAVVIMVKYRSRKDSESSLHKVRFYSSVDLVFAQTCA